MKTLKLIPAVLLSTFCVCSTPRAAAQTDEDVLKENDIVIKRETKKAVDAAADAKREVERNVKEVERQIQYAQAQAGKAMPAFKRAFGASYVNSAEPPLVVATTPLEPAALAELREDLTVMAKLLDNEISDERDDHSMRRAMGIVVNWMPGGTASDHLYLEGYGAILQTSVRFPLASPKKEEATKPAEPPKNSAWESARREIYGGDKDEEDLVIFRQEHREEYSPERVETLKKAILKALASANNFRRLDRDETVTAVVRSRTGSRSQVMLFKSSDAHGKAQTNTNEPDSTLTIRIKKADADALAAGKISEDEFRKRAKVAIY